MVGKWGQLIQYSIDMGVVGGTFASPKAGLGGDEAPICAEELWALWTQKCVPLGSLHDHNDGVPRRTLLCKNSFCWAACSSAKGGIGEAIR